MINLEEFPEAICVDVEINGRIVKYDKKINELFSFSIKKGQQIDNIIPFLYGYFPITKETIVIENINYDNFKGNIIINQENENVVIQFYQNPQAFDEWQQKIQKYNQNELIKNIVMKTNSKSLTCNVFYTLGFMTFKKSGDKYELIGDIPNWFKLLFPNYNYSSLYFDLINLFPFLEVFIPEMDILFKQTDNGRIVSGLWTEVSDLNDEIILQASAVKDNGHNFIFIESISDRNPNKQKNLQKLREQTLLLNQLKKTEEVLRNVLKNREQFISIFSHDIKGPISGVFSLMELLRNEEDFMSSFKENHIHLFDIMYKDLRDLYEYSNKLYDWSNVNFGNMKLDKIPYNLFALIDDISINLRSKTLVKNIKINIDIPRNINALIDPVFFKNVIYNLITNAIKFSNPMGIIEIKASEMDNVVNLVIKDSGVGIEKNLLKSLFNFDNKVTKLGTSGERGTGIGLTIVKNILNMHNAKLNVKSEVGIGTEITIIIYN